MTTELLANHREGKRSVNALHLKRHPGRRPGIPLHKRLKTKTRLGSPEKECRILGTTPKRFLAPLSGEPRKKVCATRILYAPSARTILRRSAPPPFQRRLSEVALRAYSILCRQSRRASAASDYNRNRARRAHLSPISEAASVPYKNPSPKATPLKAVSRLP